MPGAYFRPIHMAKRELNALAQRSGRPELLSRERVLAAMWESVVDAFVKSILVLLFGSIAIGLVSGIWRQMTPSTPPGFSNKPELESTPSTSGHSWEAALDRHRFLIVFGVIFAATLWIRLMSLHHPGEEARRGSRLQRIGRRLAGQWFGLIIVNAFGALITAMVLAWFQRFTVTKMLFGWLLDSVVAGIQNALNALPGASGADAFKAWCNWYYENQLRFNFWVFYLAAICDDLGVPNSKTLGRWIGRKLRKWKNAQDTEPPTSGADTRNPLGPSRPDRDFSRGLSQNGPGSAST